MIFRRLITLGVASCWFAAAVACAQNGEPTCGRLKNHYGPFDYRTDGKALEIVESVHFTPQVEALIRGSTGSVGGDIGYTLATSPNHHRALLAMTRLAEKQRNPRPAGASYTVDCYFDRAIRFKPDDNIVRMIFANYLIRNAREAEARAQLKVAEKRGADNGFTQYNIGLLYFDMKDYDSALSQAHKAVALGFEQPALKEKLQAAGKWSEPGTANK